MVSGDRFDGVTLPGDAPTDDALAEFPQLANLQRLYHGVPNGFAETREGRLPASARDGLRDQRDHDVQSRRRPIPEPRADQHDGRLWFQCSALGNADGHQRQRGYAGRRLDSQLPARWCVAIAGLHQSDVVGVERHGRSRAAVADARTRCRMSAARRRISSARATSTSCSRARFRRTPVSTPTRCGRIWASAASRSTRRPGKSKYNSLQAQVERRGTRGVGFSVAYTFSRTKDDGSGRGDILPNAYDDSGFYGISDLDRPHVLVSQVRYRFPTLESSAAPLRWVLGNWDVSGIFQAQSGAPFDVTHASG